MMMYEFTTVPSDDEKRVIHVSGRIADHRDPKERTEWITFRFAIDEPSDLSDRSLRRAALRKASGILNDIATGIASLDYPRR